jgi:threonine aldolase
VTSTAERTIDLRSDTVTKPTPAMRRAMAEAEVGDDALGDDPTAQRLEAMAAERMGKEAGLFTASGTMANLVALLTHCGRGEEAIAGQLAHIVQAEVGGAAGVAGVNVRQAANDAQGRMDLAEIRDLIRPREGYFPRTAVICLENTHNYCNGSALPASYTAEVAALAHEAGAALHIDGARIFNAACALETTPQALAKDAESVTFCLSKGLAAPMGSVICGSADFIARARKNRRMVGGGLRQAGVVAAAGIVALDEMVDRLADDHANARYLAEGLATIPGIAVDPSVVQTNILFWRHEGIDTVRLNAELRQRGVLSTMVHGRLRMLTHYGIERQDIDDALATIREVTASLT